MNKPFIRLEGVSRWFGAGQARVKALTDISLTLAAGSQTALIGPSGSGKTTLLNLIGALDHPTQGEIYLDAARISHFSEGQAAAFRRQRIGFIFQDDSLFPELRLAENIELPLVILGYRAGERRYRVDSMLKALGLEKRRDSYSTDLSGGEKQRAAVARAVIHRPQLLLADEPTANLDADSAAAVLQIMQQLAEQDGLTVLVSTHDERVFKRFEERIVLNDGRLDRS